ncbi:MAG: glycosyl hydrolase 53 family protein [Sedimentisphaerales bacterium]|nr:glycosyl hydrolase 53 family protein [Sedimentisphaerales bacterium]
MHNKPHLSSGILRKCIFAFTIVLLQVNAWHGLAICHGQESSGTASNPASIKYLGADISALAGGRGGFGGRGGGDIYQENGQAGDEISIMTKHGWNAYRLRVFVSPVRMAPNNSLENTIELAKKIKAAGAALQLDIHYSDTWADPQHQETPIAWRNMNIDELEKQVEQYSSDVIKQMKDAGVMPDMVQVGNEITGGMLWPLGHVKVPPSDVKQFAGEIQPLPEPYDDAKQWSNLIRLIKAGLRGVKAGAGDAKMQTIIHIDCGGDWPITKWFFDHLAEAQVDFDIIGQSFYPNYHGTLTGLQQNMHETYRAYNKPIMITETGYPQTGGDEVKSRKYMEWPGTPQGQLQFMVDLVNTVRRVPYGLGVFYWAPEGRGRGNALWNSDGSPAPAIHVLNNLDKLMKSPDSRTPVPLASISSLQDSSDTRPAAKSTSVKIPYKDYIIGADISWVQAAEERGTKYSDNGVQKDILEILKDYGFNFIRLRTFVDPTKATPRDRPYSMQGYCDLPHTIEMSKRVKAAGMGLSIDFHYSDSWADPGKQFTPSAWLDLSFDDLVKKMHDYTKDAIEQLKAAGAKPDMVQIGNEITPGIMTDRGGSTKNWTQLGALLKAGIAAAREVDPNIIIVLHIDKGGDNEATRRWVDAALAQGIEFDVLGQSCYTRWQGQPADWKANFADLAARYPKLAFLIAELAAEVKEAHEIMLNLPDKKGLGTIIWEPTANNNRQALFNNQGAVIPERMALYSQIVKEYQEQRK